MWITCWPAARPPRADEALRVGVSKRTQVPARAVLVGPRPGDRVGQVDLGGRNRQALLIGLPSSRPTAATFGVELLQPRPGWRRRGPAGLPGSRGRPAGDRPTLPAGRRSDQTPRRAAQFGAARSDRAQAARRTARSALSTAVRSTPPATSRAFRSARLCSRPPQAPQTAAPPGPPARRRRHRQLGLQPADQQRTAVRDLPRPDPAHPYSRPPGQPHLCSHSLPACL